MKVEIYSKPQCPFCVQAKALAERELHDLLGKTVTVRSINNDEFIGKLISMDEDFIVMQNPRSVLINGPDVILGPFLLTAKADIVPMQLNNVLCVVPTLPEAEKDYKDSVLEEANAEESIKED